VIVADYYRILGVKEGCSVNDLKRAYRIKARQYHPDINHHPGAVNLFIAVTEAYEFLLGKLTEKRSEETGPYVYGRDWNSDQRERARARAAHYSRMKFESFTHTETYRTTRIFDGTTIIYGLLISLLIIGLDIYSYTLLKSRATTEEDEPSLVFMLLILTLGIGFFAFAYMNLLSFIHSSKKRKQDETKNKKSV